MKKFPILLLAILTIFISCSKDSSTPAGNNNPNTNTTDSFKFIINGITDVKMGKDTFVILALGVARESGTQEKVTLAVNNLPANVTAEFMSQSGTPDFATTLTLTSKNAIPGAYALKVTGTTESGKTKSYDLALTIEGDVPDPVLGCAKNLLGNFTSYYSYNSMPHVFPNAKIESTGNKDEIKIYCGGFTKPVIAQINCDQKKLIVADQPSIDWNLILGSGSFIGKDTVMLNYSVTNGSQTIPVSEVLVRN